MEIGGDMNLQKDNTRRLDGKEDVEEFLRQGKISALLKSSTFFFFREFYYMQMEKYAKQAFVEGVKHRDEASKN
jgi:hypothetical protein